jgi:hypothetical protein
VIFENGGFDSGANDSVKARSITPTGADANAMNVGHGWITRPTTNNTVWIGEARTSQYEFGWLA